MDYPQLRRGAAGWVVKQWQRFLRVQGFGPGPADGIFGPNTDRATRAFQVHMGLTGDGVVGPLTWAVARGRGMSLERENDSFPNHPSFSPLATTRQRQAVFGKFDWRTLGPATDRIEVLGGWALENIVRVHIPQLAGVTHRPADNHIWFHRRAANQIQRLFRAWEEAGLLGRVHTWHGSYVPRFIRGRPGVLSSHAFGTAFDINAPWNGLGKQPAVQGHKGSVRELVPIANRLGFYWGGHFRRRPDGMHFEVAVLLDEDKLLAGSITEGLP